mmetsp:Transcript_60170/g.142010  ORF Transcript_60170/g.142010 Transcript_60170/m.142010 type:complete len:340 (-) Transcript_60170:1341-2360(-)
MQACARTSACILASLHSELHIAEPESRPRAQHDLETPRLSNTLFLLPRENQVPARIQLLSQLCARGCRPAEPPRLGTNANAAHTSLRHFSRRRRRLLWLSPEVGGGAIDVVQHSYAPDALGATLTEEEVRASDEELWAEEELEGHAGAVSGTDGLGRHRHDTARLADGERVDDRLVVGGDGGRVVEDDDLSLEAHARLRVQPRVHQHHPLPHLRPLDLLEREGDGLACASAVDSQRLVHDPFQLHRHELAVRVRAEEQVALERDVPTHQRAADHRPYTGHRKGVVDVELRQLVARLRVLLLLGRKEVEPEVEQLHALAGDVADLEDRRNPGSAAHGLGG